MKNVVDFKRNNFSGKYLGCVITEESYSAIEDETFEGLSLGDYWIINDITWRIVDFDYWHKDAFDDKPHIVIMPDQILYNARMNPIDTTEGGYLNSIMYKIGLNNAKTIINNIFGEDNLYIHKEYLCNEVTNGCESGYIWKNSTIEIPSMNMIGTHFPFNKNNESPDRLALMAAYPYFVNPHQHWYWLRDVVSEAHFAGVGSYGYAGYAGAYRASGVRPVFGIKGK